MRAISRLTVVIVALLSVMLAAPRAYAQAWQYPAGDEVAAAPFDCVFGLQVPDRWGAEAAAQVALCMRDERNFYYAEFLDGAAWLGICVGGKRAPLAGKVALPPGSHEIAIQRRSSLLQLVCDGRRMLTAYDERFPAGKVATASAGGIELEGVTIQPVAPIHMDDDFTRVPEESGEWEVISGEWRNSGELAERPKPELSANPFSYHVRAELRALAATGYEFWDAYAIACAAKACSNGAFGLAAYYQDPENYYLLRWSRTEGAGGKPGGRLQLIRVHDGRWNLLAEQVDVPYRLDVWYDLKLAIADGCLEAWVDGHLRLRARDDVLQRGRCALYADECESAFFDDVRVRSHSRYVEDFNSPAVLEGRCQPTGGRWSVQQQHLYGRAADGHEARMITGDSSWRDYVLDAQVKLKDAQRVGLLFCYQSPRDYYLVRWGATARGQGTRELVRVAGGQELTLATAAFNLVRDRFESLRVGCHRGHLTVTVGDRLALEATDTTFDGGRVGFYVEGREDACFDDVSVWFPEPPPPPPPVTEQFTKEDTMAGWVSPAACWRPVTEGSYVHSLPLFGDYWVQVQLRPLAQERGRMDLRLGTDPELAGGARLKVSCEGGTLSAELGVGEKVLASGQGSVQGASPRLIAERHGSAIIAWLEDELGERLLLSHKVGEAAAGHYVGFTTAGISAGPDQVTVRCNAVLDQTFSGAATCWRPARGVWEVHDRWACFPGWSWYGGRDEGSEPKQPIVWSADQWTGELVLEFWSALIMDLPKEPGYSDPSDLNCTIAADGRDLCSGYSFIYAGDHNTVAKIMRGNEVVAQTEEGRFINPISPNPDFHRHWFKTRVHKRGGHLEYWMDDKLLLQYDDPQPLSGGGIAIWSYNNGIILARVRISAEHRAPGD